MVELEGDNSIGTLLVDTLSEKMEAYAKNGSQENDITKLEIQDVGQILQRMNNIQACPKEIVEKEIIFA